MIFAGRWSWNTISNIFPTLRVLERNGDDLYTWGVSHNWCGQYCRFCVATSRIILSKTSFLDLEILGLRCAQYVFHDKSYNGTSWLLDGRLWIKVCDWSWPFTGRKVTLICHKIPRFPNQSDWSSLYFWGRTFIAHSLVIKQVSSFSCRKRSRRAWSRFTDLIWWHFHRCIPWTAWLHKQIVSSRSSSELKPASSAAFWTEKSSCCKVSHLPQSSVWAWSHLLRNCLSVGRNLALGSTGAKRAGPS